jgi:DNA-binding response OmpR family regulator
VAVLEGEGFRVRHFDRGERALAWFDHDVPDLLLLDLMLPGMGGLEVLRRLKAAHAHVPVIVLTARSDEADRVRGLDMGADDYVSKPFSLKELLARVRAQLRAHAARDGGGHDGEVVRFDDVEIDLRRRVIRRSGREHRLTTHEAGVLTYLVAHQGTDITREELMVRVWGYPSATHSRTVDNQILKLRKKIEDEPADPRHILTVHGVGYRFEP